MTLFGAMVALGFFSLWQLFRRRLGFGAGRIVGVALGGTTCISVGLVGVADPAGTSPYVLLAGSLLIALLSTVLLISIRRRKTSS